MPATTRKRSHEEMHDKVNDVPESSTTVIGDDNATSQDAQDKKDLSSSVSKSSAAVTNMGPPALPPKATYQKPPHSAQSSVPNTQTQQTSGAKSNTKIQTSSTENQHNAKDDGSTDGEEEDDDDAEQPDSPMPDSEPQEQIEAFDWSDLEQRYHYKMGELNRQEADVMNEFNTLCDECLSTLLIRS